MFFAELFSFKTMLNLLFIYVLFKISYVNFLKKTKLSIGSESELLIRIQIRQINWDRCLSVGVDPVQFLLD